MVQFEGTRSGRAKRGDRRDFEEGSGDEVLVRRCHRAELARIHRGERVVPAQPNWLKRSSEQDVSQYRRIEREVRRILEVKRGR
jgi:hypothetical protein